MDIIREQVQDAYSMMRQQKEDILKEVLGSLDKAHINLKVTNGVEVYSYKDRQLVSIFPIDMIFVGHVLYLDSNYARRQWFKD